MNITPTVSFSSRRQELNDQQKADLFKLLNLSENTQIVKQIPQWSATNDPEFDLIENLMTWRLLMEFSAAVAGDFPHAALEALTYLNDTVPPVYVRIYAIGGGFKRDTEYQRWARIK